MVQLAGFLALVVALTIYADSPLPLAVAGVLLLVVPEIATAARRGDKAAKR